MVLGAAGGATDPWRPLTFAAASAAGTAPRRPRPAIRSHRQRGRTPGSAGCRAGGGPADAGRLLCRLVRLVQGHREGSLRRSAGPARAGRRAAAARRCDRQRRGPSRADAHPPGDRPADPDDVRCRQASSGATPAWSASSRSSSSCSAGPGPGRAAWRSRHEPVLADRPAVAAVFGAADPGGHRPGWIRRQAAGAGRGRRRRADPDADAGGRPRRGAAGLRLAVARAVFRRSAGHPGHPRRRLGADGRPGGRPAVRPATRPRPGRAAQTGARRGADNGPGAAARRPHERPDVGPGRALAAADAGVAGRPCRVARRLRRQTHRGQPLGHLVPAVPARDAGAASRRRPPTRT